MWHDTPNAGTLLPHTIAINRSGRTLASRYVVANQRDAPHRMDVARRCVFCGQSEGPSSSVRSVRSACLNIHRQRSLCHGFHGPFAPRAMHNLAC